MLKSLRVWLALIGAGASGAAAAATPPGPDRVVLPIVDFAFGAPVIEVRLNGGAPHRFKFDSGSMELIDAGSAAAEGIRPTGITKLLEIDKAEIMPVSDTDMKLGDLDLGSVSLAHMPASGWNHPPQIDGMVGKTLLLRYVVTMDVGARQIIVTRPDAYRVPEGAIVLPMAELHGLFHVPAALDGAVGEFGLDTGLTSHVIVFPGFDQAHALAVAYGTDTSAFEATGTSGQKTRVRQAKGESLTLGGATVAEPQVLLLSDQGGVGRFDQMAGLIGMPALAQFTVTFDAPHRRLILAPAGKPLANEAPVDLRPPLPDPPF